MNLNNLTIFNFANEKFDSELGEKIQQNFTLNFIFSIEILISLSRHDIQIYDFPSHAFPFLESSSYEFSEEKTLKGKFLSLIFGASFSFDDKLQKFYWNKKI